MRLLRSEIAPEDFDIERWDRVADILRGNKGGLGDLGGATIFGTHLNLMTTVPCTFQSKRAPGMSRDMWTNMLTNQTVLTKSFTELLIWHSHTAIWINALL
jgi:hypothetical protein